MHRPAANLALLCAVALVLAACGGGSSTTTASGGGAPHEKTSTKAPPARRVPALIPPPGAPLRSVRVPVLTYHRVVPVSAAGQLDLKVDPANFAAELTALHNAGYHPISQAQLFDALYRGASLPSKPIILSFDDGYVDDVRTILPDLERYRWVGTFFVITGRMSEQGFLNAAQMRQLDQAGMDVEDHTAHHVDLRLLTPAELKVETADSRRVLQRTLGHFVYSFAYPFGYYNSTVVQAVRAAGFTMAFTTAAGDNETTTAALTMPRVHVGRAQTPAGLLTELGGA